MDFETIIVIFITICAGGFALMTSIMIAEDKEQARIRKLEAIMHEHNAEINENK